MLFKRFLNGIHCQPQLSHAVMVVLHENCTIFARVSGKDRLRLAKKLKRAWPFAKNNIGMMITHKELSGLLGEAEAMSIYRELMAEGTLLQFCQQYMNHTNPRVSRNALWVLTKADHRAAQQLRPLLHRLMDLSMQAGSSSVCRLSLNLVERMGLQIDDVRTDFLDFCLGHMADAQEYPGIQSLCMKLAFRMCSFFPELRGELLRTLQVMEADCYTPAVRSVRHRILTGRMR